AREWKTQFEEGLLKQLTHSEFRGRLVFGLILQLLFDVNHRFVEELRRDAPLSEQLLKSFDDGESLWIIKGSSGYQGKEGFRRQFEELRERVEKVLPQSDVDTNLLLADCFLGMEQMKFVEGCLRNAMFAPLGLEGRLRTVLKDSVLQRLLSCDATI